MMTAIDIHTKLSARHGMVAPWTPTVVLGAANPRRNEFALASRHAG